jgi:hypothetical protein
LSSARALSFAEIPANHRHVDHPAVSLCIPLDVFELFLTIGFLTSLLLFGWFEFVGIDANGSQELVELFM